VWWKLITKLLNFILEFWAIICPTIIIITETVCNQLDYTIRSGSLTVWNLQKLNMGKVKPRGKAHQAGHKDKHWSTWTVSKLKAVLLENGIPLPTKSLPKAYYQNLYQELCEDNETGNTCTVSVPSSSARGNQPTITGEARQTDHHHYNTRYSGGLQSLDSLANLASLPLGNDVANSGSNFAESHPTNARRGVRSATITQSSVTGMQPNVTVSGLLPMDRAAADTGATVESGSANQSTMPGNAVQTPASLPTQTTDPSLVAVLHGINESLQRLERCMQPNRNLLGAVDTTSPRTGSEVISSTHTNTSYLSAHQMAAPTQFPGLQNIGNNTATLPSYPNYGVASDTLPHVEVINSNVRKEILSGKNVNLASLLIPGVSSSLHDLQGRNLMLGQVVIPLKPDKRLSKTLTIQEFICAFTTYKNVMCEAYPQRRPELDCYMKDIIQMASTFGGSAFYEYHKLFSARASALLETYNVKVDWSRRDTHLYTTVFAGRRANSCSVCMSIEHNTDFCPLTAYSSEEQHRKGGTSTLSVGNFQNSPRRNTINQAGLDARGRSRVTYQGKEICNNFNGELGCIRHNCKFLHACLICKASSHSSLRCSKAVNQDQRGGGSTSKNLGTKSKGAQ
jgi:hypothetical protein